jgi:hypothetical protein
MEALCSSETLISTYTSTLLYNPEGQHRHLRCENLKSHFQVPWIPVINKAPVRFLSGLFPEHSDAKWYRSASRVVTPQQFVYLVWSAAYPCRSTNINWRWRNTPAIRGDQRITIAVNTLRWIPPVTSFNFLSASSDHVRLLTYTKSTERRAPVGSTPASYSGGSGFKSRPGDRLSWHRLLAVFICPSRQMLEWYLKLGYYSFLPHPFRFIIH